MNNNEYKVIAPLIMAKGIGDGKTKACLVAQAATIDALRKGKTLDKATDELHCACPFLRRLAISANDADWWKSNEERTEVLRPLIPLLLDSRGDLSLTQRRAARYATAVCRELTQIRSVGIYRKQNQVGRLKGLIAGAKKMRDLKPIKDKKTALIARDLARELISVAYAYASADADADSGSVADAYAYAVASADADAYAYAYAVASAGAVADASAGAYSGAYAEKIKYRTAFIDLFRKLAAMK